MKEKEGEEASAETGETKHPLEFNEDTVRALLKGILRTDVTIVPALEICCSKDNLLPLGTMANFQDEFKTLTETNLAKMVKEIHRFGFLEPVSIWKNGGFNYILNGHQRVYALRWMEKEGIIDASAGIPVNFVTCADAKDAARKCLALASTFGKTDRKGLAKFCKKSKITDTEQTELFAFADLVAEDLALKGKKKKVEFEAGEADDLPEGKLKCPACGHMGPEEDFEG